VQILLNGSFWSQPNVGSGQYLHGLLRWLPSVAPHHRYTLLLPAISQADANQIPLPPGIQTLQLRTPFEAQNANLAKLWFEQISIPQTAALLKTQQPREQFLLHIPYFAPPMRSSVPVITTIPDLIPFLLPEYRGGIHVQAYLSLVRHAIQHSSQIITFSDFSRKDIATFLKLPDERLKVTLLAAGEAYGPKDAQLAKAEVAKRYGLPPDFIYYVGGLDARKNVSVLIKALDLLAQQGKPLPLAIAGKALGKDKRLFPEIDGLITQLRLEKWIRRLDVPHADGPLLYQACTLFAFPSRYEGFGLPPLEAMACGAPVVVSNSSSLPEVVGTAAWQVAPDDVAGWAQAFETLFHTPAQQQAFQALGFAQAARFSWRKVAEETAQIYTNLSH